MKFIIEPAKPTEDYPVIAQMWSEWTGYTMTVQDLYEEDEIEIPDRIRQWLVARNSDYEVLGIAYVARYPSNPSGRFHGNIVVQEECRQQRVGSAFYDQITQFMQEHGATEWVGRVKEEHEASLRFLNKRGFEKLFHVFDSVLDLKTFDEKNFEGVIDAVQSKGFHFITFDTVSDDPNAQRKLYEINKLASLNEPAADGFSTFETWKKIVMTAPWFRHECEFVALDGERFVGLSGAFPTDDPFVFGNGFTGVDPEYTGQKIAQALKLLTIRQAISKGGAEIKTENDSRNVAMLAINRKLGYQAVSGHFGMTKPLE
ncbi:MAG: GNAT family N-acetyltransferase [Chloroflexota bacterium]